MSWRELLREGVQELAAPRATDYLALGRNLVRMDVNEAALRPDAMEMELFQRELSKLDLNRYPEASGRALRERLARRWNVDPEEILLGNGSVETIGMLMTTFGAARHGIPAAVIHPDPTYGQYDIMASSYGLRAVPVPLGSDFELDEGRVAAAIERERPALAFYPCPNSPTGNCFPHASLERLARSMDGVFVVDEAYADFAGHSIIPRIRDTPGLFVMRSLSKIGYAGLRVGALIGERAAIAELDKVRLPYNVNARDHRVLAGLTGQWRAAEHAIQALAHVFQLAKWIPAYDAHEYLLLFLAAFVPRCRALSRTRAMS
jgi:histidinol-phosphate aminotransferase